MENLNLERFQRIRGDTRRDRNAKIGQKTAQEREMQRVQQASETDYDNDHGTHSQAQQQERHEPSTATKRLVHSYRYSK